MTNTDTYRVYLGTYTGTDSTATGIGLGWVEPPGTLRVGVHVAPATDASYLAISPDQGTLYAVSEQERGAVTAYRITGDGSLRELNSVPTHGSHPCHLSVDPSGRFVFSANYASGSLAVHPIAPDGRLQEPSDLVEHSGDGPHPERQTGPHAHQVVPDPTGERVLAVDLGTDSIYVYDLDAAAGRLRLRHEVPLRAGSGPRHLAFDPSGTRLYLVHELDSELAEFGYDPDSGALRHGEVLPMLPEDHQGRNLASAVLVSRDGRYVYASNRGHDSIAVFGTSGGLHRLDVIDSRVRGPRHMALSPDGSSLLVGGELSDTVQLFDGASAGRLVAVGGPVPAPRPVCVLPIA